MEGKTSAGFTIFCTVFSIIIHAVKWQPSSGYKHACILLVVILFFTLSTHVTVPVIQWELKVNHAMPATPRYQCLLGNTEENELFLCECVLELPSGRQLAVSAPASGHSAVTKGFQLCSVGPIPRGPVCPSTQRSHCYRPWRLSKPAVTARCYTLVGNFKQTSSKAG